MNNLHEHTYTTHSHSYGMQTQRIIMIFIWNGVSKWVSVPKCMLCCFFFALFDLFTSVELQKKSGKTRIGWVPPLKLCKRKTIKCSHWRNVRWNRISLFFSNHFRMLNQLKRVFFRYKWRDTIFMGMKKDPQQIFWVFSETKRSIASIVEIYSTLSV